jgi:hypothetical protein
MAVRQALFLHVAGAEIDRAEPGGAIVLLKINLQQVPRLAVRVRHKPPLPDIHSPRRFAQGFGPQNRGALDCFLQFRLLPRAPEGRQILIEARGRAR